MTQAPHSILDGPQRSLLEAVLSRLIPAKGELPGAGGLGIATSIERTLATTPQLRRLLLDGLTAIDLAAARRAPNGFLALNGDARDEVLRQVESEQPTFFAALVNHAYHGYYTHAAVLRQLEATMGYPARPPQPLGHTLPPWDPAILAKQRERAPFWRRAT